MMRRASGLLVSTVGFAAFFIASGVSLGTAPDANDTGASIVRWFRDNGSHVRWSVWFLTLSLMLFAVFASLVRNRLPSPHRDVFFFGAVTLVGETAVQVWLLAGLAFRASELEPSTARVVFDVASYWGPVLTSGTVLMLGPTAVLALRRRAGLPRWLAILSGAALLEQLVETITVFGRRGYIAPGGPMNLQLGAALTTLALLCTGLALAAPSSQRSADGADAP